MAFSCEGTHARRIEQEEHRCLHCLSPALVTDWAAGDRVCTNCGVVDEEHLTDDRPEWRDFNDADDLAKGLPAAARCGLVPVDETKYLGGLQPTTLSRHVFGGGSSKIRKQLLSTNRKLDIMMAKQHARALKTAKVSRQARQRQIEQKLDDASSWEDDVRPEYDKLLLQEEEDAHRAKEALYAEKWSIERAILLHGNEESTSVVGPLHGGDEDREDLLKRLDAPLRQASADLYQAYTMLQDASRRLHLPDRVLHEATAMMRRYVTRRDGILVKGVSSRMSRTNKDKGESKITDKEAAERLRQYNKQKQSGALGSALLFLTARKLGWTRSLAEVCSSFLLDGEMNEKGAATDSFIKPKHCSRAMNEVRALFPHYGQSTGLISPGVSSADSAGNFVEHATRKLELPPVASASIRALVQHYRKEQIESGTENETKLSTMCASIAFFVCLAGGSLQRLAQQTQKPLSDSRKRQYESAEKDRPNKRVKLESIQKDPPRSEREESKLMSRLFDDDVETAHSVSDSSSSRDEAPGSQSDNLTTSSFDVFSHPAVEDQAAETRRYEMRRIWDAWSEQMPWFRNLTRIEQSCGVSRNMVLSFYKKKIFPQRHALLEVLQESALGKDVSDCALKDTPLASVLLKNITSAAPLMNNKGQL